jgi:peptidase YpeB-like protein
MPGLSRRRFVLFFAAAIAAMGAMCNPVEKPTQITRDRAIEIARKDLAFKPDSVDAVQTTEQQRQIWRVTFKGRLPDQPPGLFETVTVDVDARTGEVVSAAMP